MVEASLTWSASGRGAFGAAPLRRGNCRDREHQCRDAPEASGLGRKSDLEPRSAQPRSSALPDASAQSGRLVFGTSP